MKMVIKPNQKNLTEMKTEINVELLQPWSTFVMKTQLPPLILEKMLKITDEVVENVDMKSQRTEHRNLEDEFHIEIEVLDREDLTQFFLDVAEQFVILQTLQTKPMKKEEILNDEWYTQMSSMWVVSQKDNDYQPVHIHNECDVSTVMYLKIPKYLPSKNPNCWNLDGSICFFNNCAVDHAWGEPFMTIQPAVGDFYIFSSSQRHSVYPFRTIDGKGERRSVSYNVNFSNKNYKRNWKNV